MACQPLGCNECREDIALSPVEVVGTWSWSLMLDGSWSCSLVLDGGWSCSLMYDGRWSCRLAFDGSWSCVSGVTAGFAAGSEVKGEVLGH